MPRRGPKPTASTTARGYGYAHVKARRAALAAMQDGDPCTRCHRPMYRDQQLHLDHNDNRTGYRGLSHARCNVLAGASKGGKAVHGQRAATPAAWRSRRW